uniref:ParB-like protein n=2 Tax=Enterobacteriaceae TaxID=543 RepID=J7FWZ1_CITFR|nr:ParB-like protein [Citrobacter freundii]AQT23667.1 ParB-like protein [Leclercia adecarboxylata]
MLNSSLCWWCFRLWFSASICVFRGFVSHFLPFQSSLPIFDPAKLLVFCFSDLTLQVLEHLQHASVQRKGNFFIFAGVGHFGKLDITEFLQQTRSDEFDPFYGFCGENRWNTCRFKIGRDNTNTATWRLLNLDTA